MATRKTTGIYWECGKRTRVSFWTRRRETGGQRHRRRAPGGTARLRGCPRPLSLPNPRGRTRRTPRGKPGRPHPAAGTRTPRAATGRRSGRPSRRVAPLPSLTPKGGQLVPAEGGVAPRQAAAAQKQAARQEQHAQHRRGLARHGTARLGSARRDAQPLLSAPGDRLRRALPRGGQSSDPTPRKEGEARGGGARRGRRAVPPRVAGAGSGGGTAGSPGSRTSRAARVPLISCQRVRSPRSGSLVLESHVAPGQETTESAVHLHQRAALLQHNSMDANLTLLRLSFSSASLSTEGIFDMGKSDFLLPFST